MNAPPGKAALTEGPYPAFLSGRSRLPLPGNVIRTTAHLAILTELGITPTKSLPLIANCTGLLTTPPYRNVTRWPDSHPLVAMFDLPRRHEKRDAWAIRGFLPSYDGSGRSARAFDMILTRADDEWVTEIEDLIHID